ncbi:MAG: diguanylate cyclase [Proteobacteria bacterium]|nr:diguanylate cyclase [Pseudomonadota bacterium]MBU1737989.1 diguanylate cyclase [Pseudomonadota bacterium]
MVRKEKNILVVDDSESIRGLLGSILHGEGYQNINFAGSAEEAFKLLGLDSSDHKYLDVDIILLDIVMPGMSGIEALRKIKSIDFFADVPVVMVTKVSEMKVLEEAFSAGAMDYIVKPAAETEFLSRVRSFLKLKHEMDERKAREKELLEVTDQLTRANNTLKRLSYIDGLTGVGNRRYFDELFGKEWGRARRESCHMGLILLDVDFFKVFNDQYGHQTGDECLKKVARKISSQLKRPVDFVARYGGEEFAVVLPQTDQAGVLFVAEAIRKGIAAIDFRDEHAEKIKGITVSMGAGSIVPGKGQSGDDFLQAVDSALYQAKKNGRDRVEIMTGFASPENAE